MIMVPWDDIEKKNVLKLYHKLNNYTNHCTSALNGLDAPIRV